MKLDLSCISIVSQNMISICNQWCTRKKFWLLVIECDLPITIHPNFLFFIFPLFRDICSCFREIFCVLGECWLERFFFGNKSKTSKSAKNIEIHKNSSRVTIWSLKSYARLMTLPKTERTPGLSDLSKVTSLVLIKSSNANWSNFSFRISTKH